MPDSYPQRASTIGAGPTKQPRIGPDPSLLDKALARLKGLDPLVHPSRHLTMRESAPRPEAHMGTDPMVAPNAPGAPSAFAHESVVGDSNINIPGTVANEDPSPIQTNTTTSQWNVPNPFAMLKGLRGPTAPYDTASVPKAPPVPNGFRPRELGTPNTSPPRDADFDALMQRADAVMPRPDVASPTVAPQALDGLRAADPGPDQSHVLPQGLDPHTQDVVDLSMSRDKMLNEMIRNRERNPMGTGATTSDVNNMRRDIAGDPDTGDVAKAHVADQWANMQSASAEGFATPQERAAYGRKQAEAKINAPLEQERLRGQTALAQTQEQSRGSLAVAQENNKTTQSYYDFMKSLQAGGNREIRSISAPRGGSVSFDTNAVNPSTTNQLSAARAAYENSKGFWSPSGDSAKKIRMESLIQGALAQDHQSSETAKNTATHIYSNPKYDHMPWGEIAMKIVGDDNTPIDPMELESVGRVLSLLRGRVE